jgi:hypothetical protein
MDLDRSVAIYECELGGARVLSVLAHLGSADTIACTGERRRSTPDAGDPTVVIGLLRHRGTRS